MTAPDHPETTTDVTALAAIRVAKESLNRVECYLEGRLAAPVDSDARLHLPGSNHLRDHRPGIPSRLDTDAELRAFVLDRIETLTYDQIVQAVAAAFPPERRTSRSSLSRWFRSQSRQRREASTGYNRL